MEFKVHTKDRVRWILDQTEFCSKNMSYPKLG